MIYLRKLTNNKIWKLGQIFLKKYQMIFDYDSKTIGFYDKNDNNIEITNRYNNSTNTKKENIKSSIVKNIIQYLIFFIIILITFYLGMKIKESRKKRANELKDDDFEYSSHNNINNNFNSKPEQHLELNKNGI